MASASYLSMQQNKVDKVMEEYKDIFSSPTGVPDLQKPFEIEIDASDYVVGAVLTQHSHHMAYHSETLSYVVRKHPTYDK